jgi:zinc protease
MEASMRNNRFDMDRKLTPAPARRRSAVLCSLILVGLIAQPIGAFDLARARRFELENGLELLVLEEPAMPLVSVQMLYRVGARNEPIGRSGLAHFLEHMAFRASQNFPDTEVVSAIYAVGGEWHGYTWLDQTTYFETLPAEDLDLALRIEADRMARLEIPAAEVEAERGAVLAEMHGYENDPASVLHDIVLAVSFLQHPYRNNTIGWESDVESIDHDDLVAFYHYGYCPANAVLAVVGRVEAERVLGRVRELFGAFPGGARLAPPATVEPPQRGVRRVEVKGPGSRNRFEIAYRAPAITDPDWPAFLLLQQVLAGGRGVNFAQNEFGDPVRPTSRLAGITADLVTWYPPQAEPYVITIAGSTDPSAATGELEARLQAAVDTLLTSPPTPDELGSTRARLLDELVFDLETTEDAAHQLAYYEGLDAFDVLLDLPDHLAAVTAEDISRLASSYLRPDQRTIGWYLPGKVPGPPPAAVSSTGEEHSVPRKMTPSPGPSEPPLVARLAGGVPVIFQRVPLSPAAYLRVLVPATGLELADTATPDDPVWRHTSLNFRFRPPELEATLAAARAELAAATPAPLPDPAAVEDPTARLTMAFDELLPTGPETDLHGVTAVALVGDLRWEEARPALEAAFGDLSPVTLAAAPPPTEPTMRELVVDLGVPAPQWQLGYVVAAPPPDDPDWLAWRALLYVLTHGYEGRLGVEAISRRGLIYYVDSAYLSDGVDGRVSWVIGVDPAKLDAMRELFDETMEGLATSRPSDAEVAEARSYLRGRRLSAAQSNAEISAALLTEWVGHGRLLSDEEFESALNAVSREHVARVIPAFLAGTTVVVKGTGP